MSEEGKKDEFDDLYEILRSQLTEDRAAVKSIYDDLKSLVKGDEAKYAMCGDTLAKYADVLVKQTAQMLELTKVAQKNKPSDSGLTLKDIEKINKEIKEHGPQVQ